MKRLLVACAFVCVGFMLVPDSAAAQECAQRYASCVQGRQGQCEEKWRACMQKCMITGLRCNPDPECQAHCTENSCPQRGSTNPNTTCCAPLVGPQQPNPCPNKICGNCQPKQEQGGKPPEMPKPPQGGQGGGQPPAETPQDPCATGARPTGLGIEGFGTECPQASSTPALVLTADPALIVLGATSTLSWIATNTTSCSASDGWSGTKAATGTMPVSPTTTTIYTLECTGAGGSITKSTTVTVSASSSSATTSAATSAQTFTERLAGLILDLTGRESDEEEEDAEGRVRLYFRFFPFLEHDRSEGSIRRVSGGSGDGTWTEDEDGRPISRPFIDTIREASTFMPPGVSEEDSSRPENFAERFRSRLRNFLALWGF